MSKAKVLKSLIKKAKKPSGIKKSAPRYVKTASGMKLNPERFKQKPQPKAKRLVASPKKEALKDTARIGAAGAAGFAVGKIDSAKKAKAKENKKKTQTMAAKAVEKQKQKQKEYRQKKGGKGNR
tara:strand:- start:431 stop:802 length:372 start_codon:yes stop_codon:yes gene_type:complete